jgi:hypothetical protein
MHRRRDRSARPRGDETVHAKMTVKVVRKRAAAGNNPAELVRPETDGDTGTSVSPPPQPRPSLWSPISKAFVDIVRSQRE